MKKSVSNSFLYFSKSSINQIIIIDKFSKQKIYNLNTFTGEYSIENVQEFYKNICEYQSNNKYNVDKHKLESISLWWFYNRLIYENICVYSNKYKKLLQFISQNKNYEFKIITSDEKLKFLIHHYCTFNKIKIKIYDSFFHKINLFLSTILKLVLTVMSLPFLLTKKNQTLIFTSNNFSKYGKFDYRFYSLFSEIQKQNIKYFIGIRTINYPLTILSRFIKRGKPIIFFDSINEICNYIFPTKYKSNCNYPDFLEYISDAKNLVNFNSIKYSLNLHKFLLKLISPNSALIADNCERSNILLVSCNQLSIPTIGIMNGVETVYYNVQKFYYYSQIDHSLFKQKHYGVWSEGIKRYYLKKSKLYKENNLEVSGKLRINGNHQSKNCFTNFSVKNICWLIEIHVDPFEIIPYLKTILKTSNYRIYFKLDPTKYENSLNYFNILKLHLSEYHLEYSDLAIEDAVYEYDLFIGAFTTALIDAISAYKPILIINTLQWGNYFDIDENMSLLVKSHYDIIYKILNIDYNDQLKFKNIFSPDNNLNGPQWIISKIKKYDKKNN